MHDHFPQFIERVLVHEGGFISHPRDPGGATNYGITERVARQWGYKGAMRELPRDTAIAIYRLNYWTPIKGDQLPPSVAFQVLDAGINHGVNRAAMWLQQAAGVTADGQIGPMTLAAVKAKNPASLILKFNQIRADFYTSLGTFGTFGKGWIRRLANNLKFAADDLT